MEEIAADFQLFQELGIGRLAHVGVAVVLLVPDGVVVHGLLERGGNAHIVHHQAALLIPENAVYAGDGLHQVVSGHGLVHVHGGQGRYVKTGEPHVHHDGDFQRGVVVLEFAGQLLLVGLVADDLPPFLRVVVALGHDHGDLFRPVRVKLEYALVNLHGDGAGIRHNHGLAREQMGAVVFVMVQNVIHQRGDGLVRPQNGLHLAQLLFAFFDDVRVGILRHQVIFRVDKPQGVFVQLQVDDPAFVVDRTGGAVLHCLGHVVDVDIVAEHVPGTAVPGGDGRAGKADVGCVWQAVADDAGRANGGPHLQLALFILAGDQLFGEAILAPVGLIRHDHDVPALRQGLSGFLELLHGGEDDAVGLAARQQRLQMLAAFGLLGRLAQEIPATGELAVELVIQVVSVGDDHDGGAFQRLLQVMGIEHHGQGFSAALGMPEHAALAIGYGGMPGGFDGLFHGEILMIARQNLEGVGAVHIEADEVAQDVQKPRLFKDALKEGVKLGVLGVFVAAILGLPLHEAVLAGGDGARLGGGQVAHDAHLIVDEQRRNLVHVVAQLPVGGGGIRLLAGGGLELHHHQRQAVDKQHHVGPLLAVFHHRPLVDDYKAVVLRALVVHQVHQTRALLALHHELDRHAVLQIVGKDHVFLQEGAGGKVFELIHRIVQRRLGQGGVDRPQRGQQLILIQGRVIVPLDVRAVGIGVAQGLGKKLQDGVFVVGFGEGHGGSPLVYIRFTIGIAIPSIEYAFVLC